jgi:uncharacterized protein (TIGR02271 family)
MSRTITALFDQRSDAEAAKARLEQSHIHAGHVTIHDQSSHGYSDAAYSTGQEPGFWGSVKNAFLPEEDRHTYEEGIRRGGVVLTADVSEDQVDEAVRVLEESDSIDIEDRSRQWRESGWDYAGAGAAGAGLGAAGGYEAGASSRGLFGAGATGERATAGEGEQVIPVVEEELIVGKREVSRGGARVRSYVTETPVEEQLRLREERVHVERRPVDRPVTDADDAFRDRTIEVTATGEEAVVRKDARVVEEVVVGKTADTRTETIADTVRRTEVEVEDDTAGTIRPGTDTLR